MKTQMSTLQSSVIVSTKLNRLFVTTLVHVRALFSRPVNAHLIHQKNGERKKARSKFKYIRFAFIYALNIIQYICFSLPDHCNKKRSVKREEKLFFSMKNKINNSLWMRLKWIFRMKSLMEDWKKLWKAKIQFIFNWRVFQRLSINISEILRSQNAWTMAMTQFMD